MKTTHFVALVAVLPFAGGWSSCDGSLIKDPSFDAWCGDHLCDWRTDSGMAVQSPTWHSADHGVALLGDPAQISQLVVPPGQLPKCIEFEAMTDLGADASVTLAIDFGDDGASDFSAPVPATHWETVKFMVTPPAWFATMRVILRKTGAGRAVVAHMRLLSTGSCTDPPVTYVNRPLGTACEQSLECTSTVCAPGVFPYVLGSELWHTCGECTGDGDCMPGQACGVAVSTTAMYASCRPAGEGRLGARCLTGANCQSGVCCETVCSACCRTSPCTGPRACEPAPIDAGHEKRYLFVIRPNLCAPGRQLGMKGELCVSNADCASGTCLGSGSLDTCWLDGRSCTTASDCVVNGAPSTDDLACVPIGIANGRCQ